MSLADKAKGFIFRQAEELLSSALPDINKALNELPKQPDELKPIIIMSFTDDNIFLTIAFTEVFTREGKEPSLIITRIFKKLKLSELNELTKKNEKPPLQLGEGEPE